MPKFNVSVTVYHKTFEVEAADAAEVREQLEFYDWGMAEAVAEIEEVEDVETDGWS